MGSPATTPDRFDAWPEQVDVLILPGLPGRVSSPQVGGTAVYPTMTIDVMKLLREEGLRVEYAPTDEPRAELALKAAEHWVPVVLFAREVLVDGGAHAFVEVIWDRIRGRRNAKSILHLKAGRRDGDGAVEWFESDGRADDVLEAFERWGEDT
jgi:hypothetical protein